MSKDRSLKEEFSFKGWAGDILNHDFIKVVAGCPLVAAMLKGCEIVRTNDKEYIGTVPDCDLVTEGKIKIDEKLYDITCVPVDP